MAGRRSNPSPQEGEKGDKRRHADADDDVELVCRFFDGVLPLKQKWHSTKWQFGQPLSAPGLWRWEAALPGFNPPPLCK
jgi:hypothetical protein